MRSHCSSTTAMFQSGHSHAGKPQSAIGDDFINTRALRHELYARYYDIVDIPIVKLNCFHMTCQCRCCEGSLGAASRLVYSHMLSSRTYVSPLLSRYFSLHLYYASLASFLSTTLPVAHPSTMLRPFLDTDIILHPQSRNEQLVTLVVSDTTTSYTSFRVVYITEISNLQF